VTAQRKFDSAGASGRVASGATANESTPARHALRPPAPGADEAEQGFYIDDLDFVWDPEHRARREQRGREQMPTLPDEDPLRYDIGYDRERDATRDSMPTIPDLDPLRHDSELPSRPDRVEQSYTFRKVR
jgi:hypothetical protein